MDINKYLGDLVGARELIARDKGTIAESIRQKYTARRESDKQPEATKIEEKPDVVAEVPEVPAEVPDVTEELVESKAQEVTFKAVASNDLGVVVGIGGAAGGADKLDLDGEFMEKSDLVKMAYDFTSAEKRVFKANHKDAINAKLVESWVGAPIIDDNGTLRTLKADEKLDPSMSVVGIDIRKGNETHWFVGSQLPEELKSKASEVVGYSWGAGVVKTEV